MDVSKSISNVYYTFLFKFVEALCKRHEELTVEQLLQCYCTEVDSSVSYEEVFLPMLKISKKVRKVTIASPRNVEEAQPKEEGERCEYIYARGDKKGQRCSIMAKTGPRCSKHKKNKSPIV